MKADKPFSQKSLVSKEISLKSNPFEGFREDLLICIFKSIGASVSSPSVLIRCKQMFKRLNTVACHPLVLAKITAPALRVKASAWFLDTARFLQQSVDAGSIEAHTPVIALHAHEDMPNKSRARKLHTVFNGYKASASLCMQTPMYLEGAVDCQSPMKVGPSGVVNLGVSWLGAVDCRSLMKVGNSGVVDLGAVLSSDKTLALQAHEFCEESDVTEGRDKSSLKIELVWDSMGKEQQQQQKRGMRGINRTQTAPESKLSNHSQCYPVSSRAYTKKDYDYLSTFPRVAHSIALKTSIHQSNVELSREQSDGDSDFFMTTSSVDSANSLSSASSTSSSAQSYAKYSASLTDMESDSQRQSHSHHDRPHQNLHHHRQHQKHPDDDQHLQLSKTGTFSPQNLLEKRDLQTVDEEKSGSESNSEVKNNKLDLSSPADNGFVEVKEATVRLRPKVRSRHIDKPAALPKFGSWDTKNPSSGESYTLIFRRLRDEKQSGAVPVCGSPTHPKEEEVDEPLRLESKVKEPLCLNSCARKDIPRRKTKNQEAAQSRTRWILCCKTSVLDD
ncbi:hypothetical protein L7F22_038129 [Adiantum nelumboides]|nr:hypothetical protein [Adiantum nelumboides]